MCLLFIWRLILFMIREPCSHLDSSPAGRGLKGCTHVYHWHQNKHYRNASSLAHLPNSAFSLTDFKPLCRLFCCLKRTFLSGLQLCRSQYFNTLLLENVPFLILPLNGFPLWSQRAWHRPEITYQDRFPLEVWAYVWVCVCVWAG